jgi:hypothetical protein
VAARRGMFCAIESGGGGRPLSPMLRGWTWQLEAGREEQPALARVLCADQITERSAAISPALYGRKSTPPRPPALRAAPCRTHCRTENGGACWRVVYLRARTPELAIERTEPNIFSFPGSRRAPALRPIRGTEAVVFPYAVMADDAVMTDSVPVTGGSHRRLETNALLDAGNRSNLAPAGGVKAPFTCNSSRRHATDCSCRRNSSSMRLNSRPREQFDVPQGCSVGNITETEVACGAGLPLLAIYVTGVHFLIMVGFSQATRRLHTAEECELLVYYLAGAGTVRDILKLCTGRAFAVQEVTAEEW